MFLKMKDLILTRGQFLFFRFYEKQRFVQYFATRHECGHYVRGYSYRRSSDEIVSCRSATLLWRHLRIVLVHLLFMWWS